MVKLLLPCVYLQFIMYFMYNKFQPLYVLYILSRLKRLPLHTHTHTHSRFFLLLFSAYVLRRRGLSLRKTYLEAFCASKGSRSPPKKTLAAFAKRPPLQFPSINVLQPYSTPLKRRGGPKELSARL